MNDPRQHPAEASEACQREQARPRASAEPPTNPPHHMAENRASGEPREGDDTQANDIEAAG